MEHPIKTVSNKILNNMTEKDFRRVKSYVGVVETSCTIVEEAYKRINPGERVPFGYTTSNSKLQEKLGVKK